MRYLLLLAMLFCSTAWAETVTLTWDYGTATVTGFKGYCSSTSGTWPAQPTFTTTAAVKQAQVTFTGRYFCTVRAYDAQGESADSNVLALLEKPTNLRTASQSVEFDPLREKVAMQARILDKDTGELLGEVTSEVQ